MKQQQQSKKKKKRSKPRATPTPTATNTTTTTASVTTASRNLNGTQTEAENLAALVDAFDSVSVEGSGDSSKGEEISTTSDSVSIGSWSSVTANSSSSVSGSSSSSGSLEGDDVGRERGCRGGNGKQKRMVAVTGTVSTVLGKEYVRRRPLKVKEFECGMEKEDMEQFLCSMFGDDSELNFGVVRDVLCGCGYNLEKALDALLDLSASTYDQLRKDSYLNGTMNYKEDWRSHAEHVDTQNNWALNCFSHSSQKECHESIWGNDYRNYSQVVAGEVRFQNNSNCSELDLPQKVLESLFNISKSSEYEPNTMNWRNVVKRMQSLGPTSDSCSSSDARLRQDINGIVKGDEYHRLRKSAKMHWESMSSYYQKAATAFSKEERDYAAYLSDQGKVQAKLAREADKKASQDIFDARNQGIENVVTIDLHGQHVKQAMRLLKIHLLFGTYVHSIQTLRVITGCGSHGLGRSKLKQSAIKLLQDEGIKWSEENQGTILIKLEPSREYSFTDADGDVE